MVQQRKAKIILTLLVCTTWLHAQEKKFEDRINSGLKMNFPSIYFKHNSTDYAEMPYAVDSCFKYIADHIKYLNDLTIWRDSIEVDQLAYKRIKKLRADLSKYTLSTLNIQSMGDAQKISQHTIYTATDPEQIQYLLALNSVFDVSGAIRTKRKKEKWKDKSHVELPRPWCWSCWRHGFWIKEHREMKKAKRNK
jgi:hypothetical protein